MNWLTCPTRVKSLSFIFNTKLKDLKSLKCSFLEDLQVQNASFSCNSSCIISQDVIDHLRSCINQWSTLLGCVVHTKGGPGRGQQCSAACSLLLWHVRCNACTALKGVRVHLLTYAREDAADARRGCWGCRRCIALIPEGCAIISWTQSPCYSVRHTHFSIRPLEKYSLVKVTSQE